jgi:hypothetical protein
MAAKETTTLDEPKDQAPPKRIVVKAEPGTGKGKVFPLLPDIVRPMVDWVCVEPSEPGGSSFVPALYPGLRVGDGFVLCRTVVMRARKKYSATGLRHAEGMFMRASDIPKEFEGEHSDHLLIFPEIWRSPEGKEYVPVLCMENHWIMKPGAPMEKSPGRVWRPSMYFTGGLLWHNALIVVPR